MVNDRILKEFNLNGNNLGRNYKAMEIITEILIQNKSVEICRHPKKSVEIVEICRNLYKSEKSIENWI